MPHRGVLTGAIATVVSAAFHAASAENLDGFVLRDWNRMECRPAQLIRGENIEIALPHDPGDYLSVLAPGGHFYDLIYPSDRRDLISTSEALATMPALTLQTHHVQGIESRSLEPVFVQPGTYTILVGKQFETDRPITRGWCRVELRSAN